MTLDELEQEHQAKTKQEQAKTVPDPCGCRDVKVYPSTFGPELFLMDTYKGLVYMKMSEDGRLIPAEEDWGE
jgi:hypothetical protein